MTDTSEHCPVHGRDEPGWEWPCPVAYAGVEPGVESCPHLTAELQRRIDEVKGGHYFQMGFNDDGTYWSQEYRDHQPYGLRKARGIVPDHDEDDE